MHENRYFFVNPFDGKEAKVGNERNILECVKESVTYARSIQKGFPISQRGQQQNSFSAMSRDVSFSACTYEFYVTCVHLEAPCALILEAFGVMPSPGPSGTSAYPLLINGFAIPSTTLSYHESDDESM